MIRSRREERMRIAGVLRIEERAGSPAYVAQPGGVEYPMRRVACPGAAR
jgi:hypothetical protein